MQSTQTPAKVNTKGILLGPPKTDEDHQVIIFRTLQRFNLHSDLIAALVGKMRNIMEYAPIQAKAQLIERLDELENLPEFTLQDVTHALA